MLNVKVNLQVSGAGKSLLQRYERKELTEAEFDTEIAYLMLSAGIQEMRYRKNPPTPNELVEYQERKAQQPHFTMSSEFWGMPVIKKHTEICLHNLAENNGNWYWLKELKRIIPEGDFRNRSLILEVMESYREHRKVQKTL